MNSLKIKWLLAAVGVVFALSSAVAADKNAEEKSKGYLDKKKGMLFSPESIAKRTAPVGKIFVEGDDVPTAAPPPAPENTGPRSGEMVYNTYCAACHAGGMPNAPAFGSEVWSTLAQRGLDDLYTTAVAGLPTGMPAKGGCMDCSEDELKNTIQYMLDSAK